MAYKIILCQKIYRDIRYCFFPTCSDLVTDGIVLDIPVVWWWRSGCWSASGFHVFCALDKLLEVGFAIGRLHASSLSKYCIHEITRFFVSFHCIKKEIFIVRHSSLFVAFSKMEKEKFGFAWLGVVGVLAFSVCLLVSVLLGWD